MEKRERNKQLKIYLTDEEMKLFKEKKNKSQSRTMNHFIRKCVLEKNIYVIDLKPFYKIQGLLANETNNINQIAKRVNITGVIYKNDIDDMKKMISATLDNVLKILDFLMELGKNKL